MKDSCWREIGFGGDRSCCSLQLYGHCRQCPTFSQAGRTLLNRGAPEEYLVEWASLISQERQVVGREGEIIQVFRLLSEWLALSANCWIEVVGVLPIRRIPHRTNPILLGMVSVRGEIHLCVSLSKLLGIDESEDSESAETRRAFRRFCLIKKDGLSWAFPADEVRGLVSYSEGDVRGVPATVAKSFQRFTRGLLDLDGRKVGLLDETQVFDALSRSVL